MSDERDSVELGEQPDWHAAAQALVDGCCNLPTPEERVRFLDRICIGLGDRLFPVFLKLLCIVSEQGDEVARRAVARTLVHALSTGRMPSGRLHAWGSSEGRYTNTRSLGPIEYLCAWHAQEVGPSALNTVAFDTAARAVLSLIASDSQAKALYCAKLQYDIDNTLDGTFSRVTRAAMAKLVELWRAEVPIDDIVRALVRQFDSPSLFESQPRSVSKPLFAQPRAWAAR